MGIWSTILAVFMFAAACNLDTVLLSMGYTARGMRISRWHGLVIAAVTTIITWFSLALGDAAAGLLPASLSSVLGGMVLIGIGFWFVLDYLRNPAGAAQEQEDAGQAGSLEGCISLAAALAVNNAGVGMAAGVTGISPIWAAGANFLATLASLALGRKLGMGLAGRLLGRCALALSGGMLMVLGACEAFL
jgi:putative Mn2+ efflux pump MntP